MRTVSAAIAALFALGGAAYAFDQEDIDTLTATENCERCDLAQASLGGAELAGADLERASFRIASLKGAQGLNQFQLESACGDANTILPDDFVLAPC